MRKKYLPLTLITLVVISSLVLWGCSGDSKSGGDSSHSEQTEKAPLYHCPMHPQITDSKPANCPICSMALVEVDQSRLGGGGDINSGVADRATLNINPNHRQIIGVTYGIAEWMSLTPEIRTVGNVSWDERRRQSVTTKSNGFIERLLVRSEGEPVKKGQQVALVYSPEISRAASEYLAAVRSVKSLRQSASPTAQETAQRLVDASRNRLKRLEVGPSTIKRMEKTGVVPTQIGVYSPMEGIVLKLMVNEGDKTRAGMPLMVIADPSSLWVIADVYEQDMARVHEGLAATIQIKGTEQEMDGTIDYIYPELNHKTRTGRVRLQVENADGRLRPGMYADVTLHGDTVEGVVVEESAVLQAGQASFIFVGKPGGELTPREVKIGMRESGFILVKKGLAPGESVVTSGNFLLDSESQLRASLQSLAAGSEGSQTEDKPADPHAGH